MLKFSIGDRVKVVKDLENDGALLGFTGVIVDCIELLRGWLFLVDMEINGELCEGVPFAGDELEVIE